MEIISISKSCTNIRCSGNAGTEEFASSIPIKATQIEDLVSFAKGEKIDLTIVGPDDPLARGIVDCFEEELKIFGPSKQAAQIEEASKAFAKFFMEDNKIPTASFKIFDEMTNVQKYIETQKFPIVIKASGLALGKGVYICRSTAEANQALKKLCLIDFTVKLAIKLLLNILFMVRKFLLMLSVMVKPQFCFQLLKITRQSLMGIKVLILAVWEHMPQCPGFLNMI